MTTTAAKMTERHQLDECECRVLTTEGKDVTRRLSVVDARGSHLVLHVHRFALVSPEDVIFVNPQKPKNVSVRSQSTGELIQVSPHFEKFQLWSIGSVNYRLKISELTTDQELQDYQYLESFHYRSAAVDESKANQGVGEKSAMLGTGGRKSVLIISINSGSRWESVGYIELQMPLQMVKPRHVLFDADYTNPVDGTSWNSWASDSIKKHVNRIVRIARLVVSPEHRGLGLSKILINAAIEFSAQRWHIGGRRPLFIDISAEMLRYIDFVSSCGFHFAGETEGNFSRVAKDLKYMYRNYAADTGIMTLQKSYLTKFVEGAKILGKSFEEMLRRLELVTSDISNISTLSAGEYHLFKQVIRFPRPYFIKGLDDYSEQFLSSRVHQLGIQRHFSQKRTQTQREKSSQLRVVDLRISFTLAPDSSRNVQIIRDCFGLSVDSLTSNAIKSASFEASAGNIIFVTGASGCGKSALLHALDSNKLVPEMRVGYSKLELPQSVGWMEDLPDDLAIIEYFSQTWGMERSLSALSEAGLAEAFAYVKSYRALSRGQKYRARLAQLNLRDVKVWLLDEFCADLDALTAKIVAHNLRRHVIRNNRIAIIAAANYSHFIDALRPTRVLRLRQGFGAELLTFQEFKDELQWTN